MLTWVAVASGLAAAGVVVRWWLRRYDSLGRERPKPWIGAGALVVVCLASGGFAVRHHLREARLSRVASALAGRDVDVECQGLAGTFVDADVEPGYVRWGPDGEPEARTTLKPDVCRALAAYARSPGRPSHGEVVAVHVLTHEAMHMAGLKNEAEAECAAVQRDAETARLLGADDRQATALAIRYWTVVYPGMPPAYRTAACGPGGPLDEGLGDGPWPATP